MDRRESSPADQIRTTSKVSARKSKKKLPQVVSRRSEHAPLDNMMRVTTPENISFQYEVVGPFRRLLAYLLDLMISVGGYGLLVFIFYMLIIFVVGPAVQYLGIQSIFGELAGVVGGIVTIGFFLTFWFYGAYCETYFNGATLGKSILRMRVITTDGHAIDGVQAVLRNFFRLIDTMPFISLTTLFESDSEIPLMLPTCFFGLVVMMLNRRYQRLGDLVANTVVVSEMRVAMPDLEMFKDDRVPQLAELIPSTFFVPRSMARAIADYVDNRRTLNYQRLTEIASYLAVPLLKRFKLPRDTDHDLLLCSLYYKIFVQQVDEDDAPEVAGGQAISIGDLDAVVATPSMQLSAKAPVLKNPSLEESP